MPLSIRKTNLFFLLLLIPMAIYFSFGWYHLTRFETADEHYWVYDKSPRIKKYWAAIKAADWRNTRVNDKPGITLALLGGAGMLFEDSSLTNSKLATGDWEKMRTEHLNLIYRLPVLIFNGLASLFFFWIIKKLTDNEWMALLAATFILLNPILLGISQIVNPDSLLWTFMTASLLSFLVYLKYEKNSYALLASLFLGGSLLSKYVAVILIPFYALALTIHIFYQYKEWYRQSVLEKKVWRFITTYYLIIITALLVFSLLMPAVFTDLSFLYKGTIGFKTSKPLWPFFGVVLISNILLLLDAWRFQSRGLYFLLTALEKVRGYLLYIPIISIIMFFLVVIINWSIGNNLMEIASVQFDIGRGSQFRRQIIFDQILLELYPLVFSLTPLTIVLVLFGWLKYIIKPFQSKKEVFLLSLFIIVFYAAVLQQQLLVTIRYSIMIYPIMSLLAAFGVIELLRWENRTDRVRVLLFMTIVVVGSFSLWLSRPFYFNYTNDLLPKSRIVTGAWGYGGYEAAQYLNALPGAQEAVAYSDYWGFCRFFIGQCVKTSQMEKLDFDEDPLTAAANIDYYIITRRGTRSDFKDIWFKIKAIDQAAPVWELKIDGREKNFIRVYKSAVNAEEIQPI